MSFSVKNTDPRTYGQVKDHYQIEKELASKLRSASKEQRRHLYSALYNELFSRVPLHPQLTRKSSPSETALIVSYQIDFIKSFLTADSVFMEIGPGDCSLSKEVSKLVSRVHAVDVSSEITKGAQWPSNLSLIISDGTSIDVEPGSIDVVYSNQLMEHLHPDDAFDQLKNIYKAVALGGKYICITPNRLTGPHDVSKYFGDEIASGFHLKEYTTYEIRNLFMKVGFRKVEVYIPFKGKFYKAPAFILIAYEKIMELLPHKIRRIIFKAKLFRFFLGSRFLGIK